MPKMLQLLTFLLQIFISLQAVKDEPGSSALDKFPLIDGHNDLAYNVYLKLHNQINNFSFDTNLSQNDLFGSANCSACQTDLVRIKEGKLGAQFWSAYVQCDLNDGNTTVARSFEQVDLIKRFVAKYPDQLEFVTTADGITDAFKRKKLASLIGLEGGHSIDSRMSLLRQFYALGVRYMTLTHTCNLPWADSSLVDADSSSPVSNLTEFGKKIVLEMNRLGMMVDLSHVSYNVMNQAINVSKAPVIFSHSSAYSVFPHHRNVKDDILLAVKRNDGIVMVNFYTSFVGKGNVTIDTVIDHINHIVDVAGIDHVGIGADYDGVEKLPFGLEDVSKYPKLFDALKESNSSRWTIDNLEKLAGRNLIRVFKSVEEVKKTLSKELPSEDFLPELDTPTVSKVTVLKTPNAALRISSQVASVLTTLLLFVFK